MQSNEFRRTADLFARFFTTSIPDPWSGHGKGIASKKRQGDGSTELVGTFDKEMEACYFRFLAEYFPGEPIVSEETAHTWPPPHNTFWIIDPCDGTHNMLLRSLDFGTMIARVENRTVVFSAIYLPAMKVCGESGLYVAGRGCGAWQYAMHGDMERLTVSRTATVKESIMLFEGTTRIVFCSPLLPIIAARARNIRKISATSWSGVLVASGGDACQSCDGLISMSSKPWDILPIALMIEEAGGVVTDYSGAPVTLTNFTHVVMSNGLIHNELIDTIRSQGLRSGH